MGSPFTWSNKREGMGLICERLDRFVGNGKWCNLFTINRVSHGFASYLDHVSIRLNNKGGIYTRHQGQKPLCFEKMWIGHSRCNEIIEAS